MSKFRLEFSGEVKSVEFKADHGNKPLVTFSVCKKNYARPGAEVTWTWIRVTVWDPKEWLTANLRDGVFVAGSGEFSTRTYDASSGTRRQDCEVRCSNFDIDIAIPRTAAVDPAQAETVRLPTKAGARPSAVPASVNDEPPF